mgnify:CR=1 FL=1
MVSFFKAHNTKYLLLFSVFGITLVLIRQYIKPDMRFLFLIKNLLLAWVPFIISACLSKKRLKFYVLYPLLFLWLLFFPNALYLITDYFHLWPKPSTSVWYDLIMISTFAIVGLFLALSSLKKIESLMLRKRSKSLAKLIIVVFMYLGSLGVYIGRFMRLNSWDVIKDPVYFKQEGLFFFENPFDDVDLYIAPVVFTLFLCFFYYGIFNFAKNQQ